MPQATIVVLLRARSTDEQSWPILILATRTCIGTNIVASFCALVNQDRIVGMNDSPACNTEDNLKKEL